MEVKIKKNNQRILMLDRVKVLIKKSGSLAYHYKYSLVYIALIVLLNILFVRIPLMQIVGSEVSPIAWMVGMVYVLRDFSQQELQHKVIVAMVIASILTYFLSEKAIALASVSSFLIAEFVDWAVYTFTRRPLSKRILWSASLSVPIDSIVFLWMINQFNGLGVVIVSLSKLIGVLAVWYGWKLHEQRLKPAPSC